jgi:hypothetical protein
MRGVPQATVSRLPSPESGLRWPSWLTLVSRPRRRSAERLETLIRLRRHRRQALRTEAPLPDPRRQWLRRF